MTEYLLTCDPLIVDCVLAPHFRTSVFKLFLRGRGDGLMTFSEFPENDFPENDKPREILLIMFIFILTKKSLGIFSCYNPISLI